MHDNDLPPDPPACPAWCEASQRGWSRSPGGVAQICECSIDCGRDLDGAPVSVRMIRAAFADGETVQVCDPEIEVVCAGRVDYTGAMLLSGALARAARLAWATVRGGRTAAA